MTGLLSANASCMRHSQKTGATTATITRTALCIGLPAPNLHIKCCNIISERSKCKGRSNDPLSALPSMRLPSAPCGSLCSSPFNARQIVRSTERDGGLWRAAIESKAVIPSSNIFLDYSDLAKVLTLIGALTCYSWVCFEQAKADQSELNT